MPRRVVEGLSVSVPSQRAFFGGGLDNPADEAAPDEGKRSGTKRKRGATKGAQATFAKHGTVAPMNSPDIAPGPMSSGLSGPMGALAVVAEAPISTRTRLRKRLGFPLRPPGNALVPQAADDSRVPKMSAAAARHRGAADAAANAARARRRAAKHGCVLPATAGDSAPATSAASTITTSRVGCGPVTGAGGGTAGGGQTSLHWERAVDDARRHTSVKCF